MAQIHPSRLGLVPNPIPVPTAAGIREFEDVARREESRRIDQKEGRRHDDREERRMDRRGVSPGRNGRRQSPTYQPYSGGGHREENFISVNQAGRDYGYSSHRQDLPRDAPRHRGYEGGDRSGGSGPGGGRYFGGGQGGGGGGGGGSFGGMPPPRSGFGGPLSQSELVARRQQRDTSTVTVWPKSPRRSKEDEEAEELREKERRSSRKHKSSSKHKSKSSRHKHKSSSSRKHRRKYSDSDDSSSSSDSEYERRRKKSRRTRSRSPAERERTREKSQPQAEEEEDEWEVADGPAVNSVPIQVERKVETRRPDDRAMDEDDEDDDDEVGPKLVEDAATSTARKHDPKAYAHMRPGEGAALAAYVEDGQRIPRRGEIGLTSDQIEKYENSGYVMSGSRHRRMNAVRMRKENQVITAEEKRGILKLQAEEKAKREALIVDNFKGLMEDRLAQSAAGASRS